MSSRRMKRSSPGSAVPRRPALRPSRSCPASPPVSMSSWPLVSASLSSAAPLHSHIRHALSLASHMHCIDDAAQGPLSMVVSMQKQRTEQRCVATGHTSQAQAP